jgi:hypothetical protein
MPRIYALPVKIAPLAGANSWVLIAFWRSTIADNGAETSYPATGLLQNVSGTARPGRIAVTRTFTVAAALLALLAMPAHAQHKSPGGAEKKQTEKTPQIDEKAYKAALERIPEPKEKYDPWSITKPAEPAKKPK